MSNELQFPERSDLEALAEELDARALRRLLARRGVFAFGSKDAIAPLLTRLVLSEEWYSSAFSMIGQQERGVTITGARVPAAVAEEIAAAFEARIDREIRGKSKPKVHNVFLRDGHKVVSCKYTRRRPLRTPAFSSEQLAIDINVVQIGKDVDLFAFPRTSTDPLVVKDIIKAVLSEISAEQVPMDIERLRLGSRVKLFDRVREAVEAGKWRGGQIVGVTVTPEDRSKRDEKDLSDSDLNVLNNAVLEGKNLRNHPFVEQLLEDRYYFSSIRFWASNPAHLDWDGEIEIEIAFKHNPHVVVVSALRGRAPDDDGRMGTTTPPPDLARDVVRYFWCELYKHFDLEIAASGAEAKKVAVAKRRKAPPLVEEEVDAANLAELDGEQAPDDAASSAGSG